MINLNGLQRPLKANISQLLYQEANIYVEYNTRAHPGSQIAHYKKFLDSGGQRPKPKKTPYNMEAKKRPQNNLKITVCNHNGRRQGVSDCLH